MTNSNSNQFSGLLFDPGRMEVEQRYHRAVRHAKFLSETEKKNWLALGGYLSHAELKAAEMAILNEDLKTLNITQKLSTLKPTSF